MDQTHPSGTDISKIDNYDKYLLHSRGEIIQKLRQLGKDKNLITAHMGNDSALTAVIEVLTDNDLLVLDYAANEKMNQKLISAKRVILHTQHQGITAQFTVSNIKKARFQGRSVLACPLPESLLWVQRREAYRVRIPMSSRVTCEFFGPEEKSVECRLLDISATGFAIAKEVQDFEFNVGDIFHGCKLHMAEFGTGIVDVEIRNEIELKESVRLGCTFLNINTETSSLVQRYIHAIDALQRKTPD